MRLSHLAGVLRRRRLVAVLGLLTTLGFAAVTTQLVPPEHSLTTTVLLLPPVTGTEPGKNPYLALGGLTAPAEVMARAMSDPATEQALRAQGATGTWTVQRDYMTSAPILLVTAQDASVERAQHTSDLILRTIPVQLQDLQASVNVPSAAMITSSVVTKDAQQQQVFKPLIRAVIVVVVLGLVLTVALACVVDAAGVSRRRKAMPSLGFAVRMGREDAPRRSGGAHRARGSMPRDRADEHLSLARSGHGALDD